MPLIAKVPRPWRLSIALFAHGGLEILKVIRRQEYDVLSRRPTVSKLSKLRLMGHCWWQARRGGAG